MKLKSGWFKLLAYYLGELLYGDEIGEEDFEIQKYHENELDDQFDQIVGAL